MNQSGREFGSNTSNAASLKGKLQTLEEAIQLVADEMNAHKKDVGSLKTEKDSLQEMLRLKTQEVKSNLISELNKVDDEMKRHFAHQKAENSRLQQQISQLKTEKTVLQNQLIGISFVNLFSVTKENNRFRNASRK
jgi:chromosome segregation ATPase